MAWPWLGRALQKAGRFVEQNPGSVRDAYHRAKNWLGAGTPAAPRVNPAAAEVEPVEPVMEMDDDGRWILWLAGVALVVVAGVVVAVYLGGGGGGGNGGDNGGNGNGNGSGGGGNGNGNGGGGGGGNGNGGRN